MIPIARNDVAQALTGKAPARPTASAIATATAAGAVALTLLVAIGHVLHRPVLVPPLAASAALVFAAPTLPLAQPRNVIGGQFVSACVGFCALALAGDAPWTAALAGALAIGSMALARTPHSPAAATAVLVVLTDPEPVTFLGLLLLATIVIVAVGVIAARRTYPAY
ncbi:HPP family protein [Actinomadura sp. NPDC047616]|uniref:HPP family protein n=1 Tax=Actinomadura sp. NPDC047616 TaxID=3155914 RepID=UPI0033E460F7